MGPENPIRSIKAPTLLESPTFARRPKVNAGTDPLRTGRFRSLGLCTLMILQPTPKTSQSFVIKALMVGLGDGRFN